jgi:hypothetical protein
LPTPEARHERKLTLIALMFAVTVALSGLSVVLALKNNSALTAQHEGRKVATEAFCSFGSAVSDAGRKTIAAGVALPGQTKLDADRIVLDKHGRVIGVVSGRFARFLEAHGYPLAPQRVAGSQRAAEAYARNVSDAVAKETGVKGLVKADGTLDCARLQNVSHAK